MFDKWCGASEVTDFESMRELILLEEFKNCLPECVVMYLNERAVSTASQAAVLADEFILTHRQAFKPVKAEQVSENKPKHTPASRSPPRSSDIKECFYCHKPGHIAVNCLALKKKQERQSKQSTSSSQAKGVALAGSLIPEASVSSSIELSGVDLRYQPFILKGSVGLEGDTSLKPIQVLRDTGAAQSFILANMLPFSDQSFCGSFVVCQGLEMGYGKESFHHVQLCTDQYSGVFKVAVCPALTARGIDYILGMA